MAGEPNNLAPAQATLPLEPAAAAALPPAAVAVEPAAAAAPAPAPEPAAAAAAPAPAAEPAPAPAKTELTSEKPSLLDFDKPKPTDDKAAAKPDDKAAKPAEAAKPDEVVKPADVKPTDPKADAAATEAQKAKDAEVKAAADRADIAKVASELKFEMPEQLKATKTDDPLYTGFIGAVAEATKNPQTAGQTLLKLHTDAMQQFAEQTLANQHKAFNETRDSWRTQVMADQEIGGAGHQTSMKAIARMRDMMVPEAERPAFNEFLRITGAGDHPQFLKLLHRASRYFDEPGLPPENPKPPADIGKQNGRGAKVLYDHPRSSNNRQ